VKDYKIKTIKRQAGMTLIELTVVLLILVGLAGLLVPYVGSFVQKNP
jgi:prepilin-type N-terminal cleavage/methylation domain-containing protein